MQPDEQASATENNTTVAPESAPTVNQTAAPAPVDPSPSPAVPPTVKRGPSKKVKIIAAIAGVAILLIGGSAAAFYGVILPNHPQKIVGDSLSNTLNEEKFKSAKFEGEINCVSGDSCKQVSGVTFKGGMAETGAFDANLQLKTAVTSVGLDARLVEKSLYLRLSGLDGLDKLLGSLGDSGDTTSLISQYAPIVAQLNNQWYTIDESLLKNVGGGVTLPSSDDKLSKEDTKKIEDAYRQHQFIKVNKKLADESIHGQSSYHLQATIDKNQLKAFATQVKNAHIKNLTIEQKDIDAVDKADFSKYPFEVWITKHGRMITQLATTISQDNTTVKVRVALYDYNQPVTVEKPAGAKSVLELISQLAPLYSGGVQGANSANATSLLGL